jgi:hypothetical protein
MESLDGNGGVMVGQLRKVSLVTQNDIGSSTVQKALMGGVSLGGGLSREDISAASIGRGGSIHELIQVINW